MEPTPARKFVAFNDAAARRRHGAFRRLQIIGIKNDQR